MTLSLESLQIVEALKERSSRSKLESCHSLALVGSSYSSHAIFVKSQICSDDSCYAYQMISYFVFHSLALNC